MDNASGSRKGKVFNLILFSKGFPKDKKDKINNVLPTVYNTNKR